MGRLQRSCGTRLIEKTNLSFSLLVSRELGLGVFPWYFHASVITRAYPPPCISNTSARSRIYFIVLLLRPAEKYSPYFHIFKHFYAPISIILFYPFHVSQILPTPRHGLRPFIPRLASINRGCQIIAQQTSSSWSLTHQRITFLQTLPQFLPVVSGCVYIKRARDLSENDGQAR